jgi:NitT/TauT family transport system ATP-binding protein
MTISLKNLSFGYPGTALFKDLSLELGKENPLVLLGPSGCGKTTLLRLMAGLLTPRNGEICIRREASNEPGKSGEFNKPGGIPLENQVSFVFQEHRLLPWCTVLENVMLPIRKALGRERAEERARYFLDLVSLGERAASYPGELSGGQRQRVSIARAFAYPAPALFMDEPFQSLDIPLRIELLDVSLALLEKEQRLFIAVTHDPREAVYLGRRIIVLGKAPGGIVFDEKVNRTAGERKYGGTENSVLEERILGALGG